MARLDSSVPDGTRIVVLNFGRNDFSRGPRGTRMPLSPEERQANMGRIIAELHRRHIRTIVADGIIDQARAAGMVQPDHIHLTAEGHHWVAKRLIDSVR